MKINIQGIRSQNVQYLLRRCGYAPQYSRRTGETSYVRLLRRTPYPRFHLYVNEETDTTLVLNLHLDAKQPSYGGSHAHAGEYDGTLVEEEADYIRRTLGA